MTQPFGHSDIADLELSEFLKPGAGIEREQRQPEAGNFAATQRQVALGIDRRFKDTGQIVHREADARFLRAFVRQLEIVRGVFIQQFVIDGGIKQGF